MRVYFVLFLFLLVSLSACSTNDTYSKQQVCVQNSIAMKGSSAYSPSETWSDWGGSAGNRQESEVPIHEVYEEDWVWEDSTVAIYSTPICDSEGNIYVLNDDNQLFSIDPMGNTNWDLTPGDIFTGETLYSSPAYLEVSPGVGHIYCVKRPYDYVIISVYDSEEGAFYYETDPPLDSRNIVTSPKALSIDNTNFVIVIGSRNPGTDYTTVYCFEDTGTLLDLRWSTEISSAWTYCTPCIVSSSLTPTINNTAIYIVYKTTAGIGMPTGRLAKLALSDGSITISNDYLNSWYDFGDISQSSVVYAPYDSNHTRDYLAVLAPSGYFYYYDLNLTQQYGVLLGSNSYNASIACSSDGGFGKCYFLNSDLNHVNLQRSTIYSNPTIETIATVDGNSQSSPVVDTDGSIAFTTTNRLVTIRKVAADVYAEPWISEPIGSNIHCSPVPSTYNGNDYLYVASDDGHLHAFVESYPPIPEGSSSWPMYGCDTHRTHSSKETGPTSSATCQLWQGNMDLFPVSTDNNLFPYAEPVIDTTERWLITVHRDGTLFVFDTSDSSSVPVWYDNALDDVNDPNDAVFVSCNTDYATAAVGPDNTIYMLRGVVDSSSGPGIVLYAYEYLAETIPPFSLKWQKKIVDLTSPQVYSSPVVTEFDNQTRIYFGTASFPNNGRVFCVIDQGASGQFATGWSSGVSANGAVLAPVSLRQDIGSVYLYSVGYDQGSRLIYVKKFKDTGLGVIDSLLETHFADVVYYTDPVQLIDYYVYETGRSPVVIRPNEDIVLSMPDGIYCYPPDFGSQLFHFPPLFENSYYLAPPTIDPGNRVYVSQASVTTNIDDSLSFGCYLTRLTSNGEVDTSFGSQLGIPGQARSAITLDEQNNVYLCIDDCIYAFDQNANSLWNWDSSYWFGADIGIFGGSPIVSSDNTLYIHFPRHIYELGEPSGGSLGF